jgi:two-component system nitrate/nitrite response regulator NarL
MAGAPRVVIAHDDDLIRDMLGPACARGGVLVVGEAATYDALLFCCVGSQPDVAVVADRLGDSLIEEVLPALLRTGARVIVLSGDPSPERLSRLLAKDLCGYLSHDAGPDEVVNAILAVGRGEVALNPEVLSTIIYQWRRLRAQPVSVGTRRRPVLTPRELDILAAMSDGLAAKAIALRLGVALKTVENHKIRIFEKLGVRSHAHAVTVAVAYGLAGQHAKEPDDADVD